MRVVEWHGAAENGDATTTVDEIETWRRRGLSWERVEQLLGARERTRGVRLAGARPGARGPPRTKHCWNWQASGRCRWCRFSHGTPEQHQAPADGAVLPARERDLAPVEQCRFVEEVVDDEEESESSSSP